jgi:small GTP-binding protein
MSTTTDRSLSDMTDIMWQLPHGINDVDEVFKVCIIGEAETGKTSLWKVMQNNPFSEVYQESNGFDIATAFFPCDDKFYKVRIWDCAGHKKYSLFTRQHYADNLVLLCVVDLSRPETVDRIKEELEYIDVAKAHLILIGAKSDIKKEETVKKAQDFAQQHNMVYVECSAKDPASVRKFNGTFVEQAAAVARTIEQ